MTTQVTIGDNNRNPTSRRAGLLRPGLIFLALVGMFVASSFALQLVLPAPTGPYAVGRTALRWLDPSRPEVLTQAADDSREVAGIIWYPAQEGTGRRARYFHDLSRVASDLRVSGEVSPIEVLGLPLIRSGARQDANVSQAAATFPVLVFSPGNGTNVEFYAALAEDLASHGYIVVGVNHPYDVAAVELASGKLARFAAGIETTDVSQRAAFVQGRIDVRVQDVLFVLERLEELNTDTQSRFAGRLELSRVGILGHSLGGITAAQACVRDPRFKACLNLDGLQRGGAISAVPDPALPLQPFMLVTKEEQIRPTLAQQLEALPGGSFLVQVHGARHESFTDGPLLIPSVLPAPNEADSILELARAYIVAFFDQTLKGQPNPLLRNALSNPWVKTEVYAPR